MNNGLIVLQMQDIDEVMRLICGRIGTFGCTWNEHYPAREHLERFIAKGGMHCLNENGRIAAICFGGIIEEYEHEWKGQTQLKNPCHLAVMGVHTECGGRGLGKLIVKLVLERMMAQGYDGAQLFVSRDNPAAIRIYEGLGFELRSEVDMYGHHWLCMDKVF